MKSWVRGGELVEPTWIDGDDEKVREKVTVGDGDFDLVVQSD